LGSSTGMRTCTAACRVCGGTVALEGRPLIGEVVECSACKAQLEVAEILPLVLELLAKVEVDEDDFVGF